MSSVIIEDELPDDVTNAESCFARHQEHKAEIDTRQRSVNDFYQAADKLIGDKHSASADVKEKKSNGCPKHGRRCKLRGVKKEWNWNKVRRCWCLNGTLTS